MMRSLNKITLCGNVGSDPEVNATQGGNKVASFSLATSPAWKNNETNWHKVVGWNKVADIIEQYVKKGSAVLVHGRLRYSKWTDQSGNNRKSAEVVIEDLVLLGSKGDAPQATGAPDNAGQDPDLPF